MNRLFKAEVVSNTHVSDTLSILKLSPAGAEAAPAPGQFYMVRVSETLDPLLRRPFSILRWDEASLEFLIKVRGRATALMRSLKCGEELDLLGPLGRGFPPPPPGATPLIVAGGVGIASVYPLIGSLARDAHVFYGAPGMRELCLIDEIRGHTERLHISTDDGSLGLKGSVVEALAGFLDTSGVTNPVVYACGPEGMAEALIGMLTERGVPGYLSIEERMACGVGACLGCVTRTVSGYRRVCREGPVFDVRELSR